MSGPGRDLDPLGIAGEQYRRVRLFERVARRFDLVQFRQIADWCAKEPGSVRRHEDLRTQAFRDLGDAAIRGEFGPRLFCMPYRVPTYRPFWIRRTPVQVETMRDHGHDETPDLWAARELCARWLRARDIPPPPWLSSLPRPSKPTQQAVDGWMLDYFRNAAAAGHLIPKRELDAFPACRQAIGATDLQMRAAMKALPRGLKRRRGNRDRGANRVANRVAPPAIR